MTVYFPTVISTPPAERIYRPNGTRGNRFISNHEIGTLGKRWEKIEWDHGLFAAYLTNDPTGNLWRNSAGDDWGGYKTSGRPVSDYVVFDDELGRNVLHLTKFDDTNASIHYPTATYPLYNWDRFTIAMWLKVDGTPPWSSFPFIMQASAGLPPLMIELEPAGTIRIFFNHDANYADYKTTSNYPTNEWFTLLVTWYYFVNSNYPKVYVNGAEYATTRTGSSATLPTKILAEGAATLSSVNTNPFGSVADLLISDTYYTQVANGVDLTRTFFQEALDSGPSLSGYVRGFDPPETETNHRTAITLPLPIAPSAPAEPFVINREDSLAHGLTCWLQSDGLPLGSRMMDLLHRSNSMFFIPYTDSVSRIDPIHGHVWQFDAANSNSGGNERATMDVPSPYSENRNALAFSQNGWAIEILHKLDVIDNSETYQTLISYGSIGGGDLNFAIRMTCATGAYVFYFENTSGTYCFTNSGGNTADAGQWKHLIFSHENGAGTWYLDGTEIAGNDFGGALSTTPKDNDNRLKLGSIVDASLPEHIQAMSGQMAMVRIWQRPLRALEARRLYEGVSRGRDPLRQPITNAHRRVPIAPVSNARTAAPRIITLPSPSYTPNPFEQFEVNWDDGLTDQLSCWFQANGTLGRIMHDVTNRVQPMNRVPNAVGNVATDETHGYVWAFDASADDRASMLIPSPYNEYYNRLAFSQSGWSVECLHRCDLFANGEINNLQHLAAYGGYASPNLTNWAIRLSGTDQSYDFYFSDTADAAWNIHRSEAAAVEGAWAHIVYTHPGGAAGQFYYNGDAISASVVSGSMTATPDTSVNSPLKFGAVYTFLTSEHYQQLTGKIALLRIWQRELRPNEVKRLAAGVLEGRDPLRRPLSAHNPILIYDRHWVGETREWFNPSNWSRAAGGRRGAGVPGCDHPVLFDADRPIYE